jgi:hypothetical protein
MGISFKDLFVRNYSTNWIFCIIWMVLYLIYYFGADRKLPRPIMCSDWLKLWRSSCQKLLSRWNCNIIEMMTGWSSTNLFIFCVDRKSKMAVTRRFILPLNPMRISLKIEAYGTLWEFVLSCSSQKVQS